MPTPVPGFKRRLLTRLCITTSGSSSPTTILDSLSQRVGRAQESGWHLWRSTAAALGGEAQLVTRRGKHAVVVLDAGEYERLRRGERAQAPGFIEHLLAIPRPIKTTRKGAEERAAIRLRDVVLE